MCTKTGQNDRHRCDTGEYFLLGPYESDGIHLAFHPGAAFRPNRLKPFAEETVVASPRIVVTSPWKLGLFVFLLVSGCGFGLIYGYYEFFGGSLDFQSTEALQNFYLVCGAVAFLGLLGYLAIVSAAQPADRVAHFGRRRRQLMKKASKIDDPTVVDLEEFQDEPTLASMLERWRRDRELADLIDADGEFQAPAESGGMSEDEKLRLEELGERMEQIGEEIGSLALNAALHLSRLGEEAAPLMETMDSFQSQAERIPEVAEALHRVIAGVAAPSGAQAIPGPHPKQAFGAPDSDLAAMESPEEPSVEGFATPDAPSAEDIVAPDLAPTPETKDDLAAIQDEIFNRTPSAPPAAPVETQQEEKVFELSAFGAEEVSEEPASAPQGPRVHDLTEFGAVEL